MPLVRHTPRRSRRRAGPILRYSAAVGTYSRPCGSGGIRGRAWGSRSLPSACRTSHSARRGTAAILRMSAVIGPRLSLICSCVSAVSLSWHSSRRVPPCRTIVGSLGGASARLMHPSVVVAVVLISGSSWVSPHVRYTAKLWLASGVSSVSVGGSIGMALSFYCCRCALCCCSGAVCCCCLLESARRSGLLIKDSWHALQVAKEMAGCCRV